MLKKSLSAFQLWGLAVGMVISGEYFGWNFGWDQAGTLGFLISSLIVTVLYCCFVLSYAELTTAIPHAGGPFAYAYKAFGPMAGLIAGYATLIEFLFAPPAIAFALGSYGHFLSADVSVLATAIAAYAVFSLINLFGIKESAVFNLLVTGLAVLELLVFIGVVGADFSLDRFLVNGLPHGLSGIIAGLPYAVWLFLGIEGLAMLAEEVHEPNRTIPKAYLTGIATLVVLALGVMLAAGGVGDWQALSRIDYPLPEAISQVMGKASVLSYLFASLGLFGLLASFHGLMVAYSRQLFALSRSGLLPKLLSQVNRRFATPHWALLLGGLIGILALLTGATDQLIIMSALGALVMYCMAMLSLLKLKQQPDFQAGFRAPAYPWLPLVALVLSGLCVLTLIYFNLLISVWFLLGLVLTAVLYRYTVDHDTVFDDLDSSGD